MDATLTALLAGHLIGDFVLQWRALVERKRSPGVLLFHVALVTGVTALLLGGVPFSILSTIFVTHLLMDALKAYVLPDTIWSFLSDQGVHLLVLVVLAALEPEAIRGGVWGRLHEQEFIWYMQALCLTSGVILTIPVGGIMIRQLTQPLTEQVDAARRAGGEHDLDGLERGGQYIGWLERGLVLMLTLSGQPGGIGFVLAAKSILRFGEIKNSAQRKTAEYVIIGTFLSFGWSLLMSEFTVRTLDHWSEDIPTDHWDPSRAIEVP